MNRIATLPAALDRLAETLRQADGLPELSDVHVVINAHGQPMVIAEPGDVITVYSWANHLDLRPRHQLDTSTGDVEFRGMVNDLLWSLLFFSTRRTPANWDGEVHKTQAIQPVVK